MFPLLLMFLGAFVLALLLTRHVRTWSVRSGIVDVPDQDRHDHERPTARAGGIAVFGAVLTMLALAAALRPGMVLGPDAVAAPLLIVISGAAATFALGLWDDIRCLGARTKFAVQILIALAVFAAGVRIEAVPLIGHTLPFSLSLLLTTVWLVGVTNAFNLIDGSDGVAGGAALLACVAMGSVSLVNGNYLGALVLFVLAGAVLGFLFFNFPPASIFLGDCGSLFIGFMLAAVAVVTTQTAHTALAVAVPVVSLGLPILDTLLVMSRRFLRRKPLFVGDRRHIHHILRDLGHSPRRVALLIYALCGGFALMSLLLVAPVRAEFTVMFVIVAIILWVGVQRLRIPELVELGGMVERGLAQRQVIAHNMRIRDAVALLRTRRDPQSAIAAFESAFEGGEFRRAEFWLPTEVAGSLLNARSIRTADGGCLWRWASPEPFRDEDAFEIRLPFCDEQGHSIGRLSLWRPLQRDRLYTDIRLIAMELMPEFQKVLRRFPDVSAPVFQPTLVRPAAARARVSAVR